MARRHGIPATYKAGCRCDPCRAAATAKARKVAAAARARRAAERALNPPETTWANYEVPVDRSMTYDTLTLAEWLAS